MVAGRYQQEGRGLFPNDGDGNAWGDAKLGFPGPLAQKGFTLLDPGRYQDLTDDFSAQISRFKADGDGIVTGVPIPPDFTTFWKQAAQQGFRPRIASIGKALLFPSSIEALGDIADGLSTEVWWTPNHLYTLSLTGQSAGDLAHLRRGSPCARHPPADAFAHPARPPAARYL